MDRNASAIGGGVSSGSGSPSIHSEHAMLALLEWKAKELNESNAKLNDQGYARGAYGLGVTFSATEFCRTLISDMKEI